LLLAWDVFIIGGGPAGLSAAVNVRARGKTALVVSNPLEENPLWRSERVENYLGLPGVSGAELLRTFRAHAEAAGVEFLEGKALNAMRYGEHWMASVGSEVYEAGALVLAAGAARPQKLPGEAELLGRGVSYCATCDGRLYRGKKVAVLGWTESARREAVFLEDLGCQVTYLHRPKTCEIQGGRSVERLLLDGGESLEVEGVFVLRPTAAPTDLLPGLALRDGFVAVDRSMATNLPGVFAAGDCTGGPMQVSKAAGEGLTAGQSAAKWLDRGTFS